MTDSFDLDFGDDFEDSDIEDEEEVAEWTDEEIQEAYAEEYEYLKERGFF